MIPTPVLLFVLFQKLVGPAHRRIQRVLRRGVEQYGVVDGRVEDVVVDLGDARLGGAVVDVGQLFGELRLPLELLELLALPHGVERWHLPPFCPSLGVLYDVRYEHLHRP
jgi:hypothetical protein